MELDLYREMEVNQEVRKEKKKKKKVVVPERPGASLGVILSAETHYENRIADLKENNKVLSQALESSYKTIALQDKTILDLQKRVLSQIPELLKVKLQVIVRTLQQLLELCEGASDLISDDGNNHRISTNPVEPSPTNSMSMPVMNVTDVPSVVPNGVHKKSLKKHKKKSSKNGGSSKNASARNESSRNEPSRNESSRNEPSRNESSKNAAPGPSTSGILKDTSAGSPIQNKRQVSVTFSTNPAGSDNLDTVAKKKKKQKVHSPTTPSGGLISILQTSAISLSSVLDEQSPPKNQENCDSTTSDTSIEDRFPMKSRAVKLALRASRRAARKNLLGKYVVGGTKNKSSDIVKDLEAPNKSERSCKDLETPNKSEQSCKDLETPNKSERSRKGHIKKHSKANSLRIKLLDKRRERKKKRREELKNIIEKMKSVVKIEPGCEVEETRLVSDLVQPVLHDSGLDNCNDNDHVEPRVLDASEMPINNLGFDKQLKVVLQDFMKTSPSRMNPEVSRYKEKLTANVGNDEPTQTYQIDPVPSTSTGHYTTSGVSGCGSSDNESRMVMVNAYSMKYFEDSSDF